MSGRVEVQAGCGCRLEVDTEEYGLERIPVPTLRNATLLAACPEHSQPLGPVSIEAAP